MRRALLLAGVLVLAGCGDAPEGGSDQAALPASDTPAAPEPTASAEQLARLDSRDCAEIVTLYLEALGGRDYDLAARVWNDRTIDAARLEAVFGGYRELQLAWNEPFVEGAAGSLYCTVSGTLSDAQDPARAPVEGTLLLRRVNDVPGATPEQLRWTLRSSTFVERLERPDGEP